VVSEELGSSGVIQDVFIDGLTASRHALGLVLVVFLSRP